MNTSMHPLLNQDYLYQLDLEHRLRTLTEAFANQAARDGIRILPHREIAWERFRSLPIEKQIKKVNDFSKFYRICAEAVNAGVSLGSGVELVKRAISKLGLRTCDGLYEQMDDSDVIELYHKDFTQVFRNLEMMKICSYSLLDLCVYEWPELFKRSHALTQQLIQLAQEIISGRISTTIFCEEMPDHFLEEIFSPGRHKFFVEQKLLTPLFTSSGEIFGFLGTIGAHLFDPQSKEGLAVRNITPLSK
jgi:hypothetical protein